MTQTSQVQPSNDLLKSAFGFDSFRPGQAEAISALLAGENAVVVMPTGAGKSLVYQFTAMAQEGTALVISPLISLMQDQVSSLARRRIPATFINSSVASMEQSERIDDMAYGRYRLVYVAPERLRSTAFKRALGMSKISLLAIDEAHCISQWGHDFRPDYLQIAEARRAMGNPLTAALTATATPRVRTDVANMLGLDPVKHIVTGFNRPNLSFEISYASDVPGKMRALLALVGEVDEGGAIVYTGTRRDAEEVAEFVRHSADVDAKFYHAGMPSDERTAVQDSFMSGTLPVVVATNAFGMGIDRPDVRLVVHFSLTGSLEEYYQEAGRAGRDGQPARAVLLYSPKDRALQEFFIEQSQLKIEDLKRLHAAIVEMSREQKWFTHDDLSIATRLMDAQVRVALSQLEAAGAVTMGANEGYRMQIAPGEWKAGQVRAVAERSQSHLNHKRIQLEQMVNYSESNDCRRKIILAHFGDSSPAEAPRCCDNCIVRASAKASLASSDSPVRRRELSELTRENKTALLIIDAVRRMPWEVGVGKLTKILSGSHAKDVSELGYDKIKCYGKLKVFSRDEVKGLIEQVVGLGYLKPVGGKLPVLRITNTGLAALETNEPIPLKFPRQVFPRQVERAAKRKSRPIGEAVEITTRMFEEGVRPEKIASERGLSTATIYTHLSRLIADGRTTLDQVVSADAVSHIRNAIETVGDTSRLAPIKVLLPDSISYGEIECVLAADGLSGGIRTDDESDDPPGRRVYALGETGSPEAVPELAAALSDSDGNIRRLAASALGKIGDRSGTQPLLDLLTREKLPQVRQYAVKALGKIGDSAALEALQKVAESQDEAEYTRTAASVAMRRMGASTKDPVAEFLSRNHPKPLLGPWKAGWALGFHSSYSGSDWGRSGVGELTYRLKYRSDRSAIKPLVEQAVALCGKHPDLAQVDAIVPVPPTATRAFEPVLMFAGALGAELGLPVRSAVTRQKLAQPQKEMRTTAQKRSNVARAFAASQEVRGKRVLIVDDLYDSGATIEEIARVLRGAGAKSICVLTLTRTIHSDR